MISSRRNVEMEEGGRRRGRDRWQMPSPPGPQWDARRPASEDVRVIGPPVRFRLPLRATADSIRLSNISNQSSLVTLRVGVGGELLITDLPAARLVGESPRVFSRDPKTRHHLVLRYTCYLPRIIRPTEERCHPFLSLCSRFRFILLPLFLFLSPRFLLTSARNLPINPRVRKGVVVYRS